MAMNDMIRVELESLESDGKWEELAEISLLAAEMLTGGAKTKVNRDLAHVATIVLATVVENQRHGN